jgi:hypothetical protein
MPFTASRNTVDTLNSMVESAKLCNWAGITNDGAIVTTFECVEYQMKNKSLAFYVVTFPMSYGAHFYYKFTFVHCTWGDPYEERKQQVTLERLFKKRYKRKKTFFNSFFNLAKPQTPKIRKS